MPSRPFWVALILGILAVIVFTLSASALFVFGVGVALAFFLVPVVNWLQRRGWPRWVAAIAVVVVTLLGFLILAITISAVLVSQGIAFVQALPTYLDELGSAYAAAELPGWLRSAVDSIITAVQENAENVDQGLVVAGLIGTVLDLIGGLFAWFLLPFFLFYLLKDQPRMLHSFYDRVPLPWKDDVSRILTITVGNFAQYFKAELVVGGIMFVTVTIGMVVIGIVADAPLLVEFSLLLGAIAFVMELIPQIGSILKLHPGTHPGRRLQPASRGPRQHLLLPCLQRRRLDPGADVRGPHDRLHGRQRARPHRHRLRPGRHHRRHPGAAGGLHRARPLPARLRQGCR